MTPFQDRTQIAQEDVTVFNGGISRIAWILRIAAARLRFLVVFGVALAVVGGWERIRAYWTLLVTDPIPVAAVSSDTEYFCPMDPGVISDWPSKCPVCNMTLVRRKRGDSAPLPDGVLARMQFTPYRLWLGGIGTETVGYAPLVKVIELPGRVTRSSADDALIEAEAFAQELVWIKAGHEVEILAIDTASLRPIRGKVRDLPERAKEGDPESIVIATQGEGKSLKIGAQVRVRISCPIDEIEPFRSQPTTPPALVSGEPRRLFVCMDHADVVRESAGKCPRDGNVLMPRSIRDDQRIRWWCPMHPGVTADRPGSKCDACGGMVLVPRVVSYRPRGRVLAVPSTAVIAEGSRSVVYIERGQGMFDAKAVTLGPRCGSSFPVVTGLEPGDRIVAQGAFLIDAETRLDPSLATGYFGALGNESAKKTSPLPADHATKESWLKEFSQADRTLALRQKSCPVTGKPLGSMGTPTKLVIRGRSLFLCCDGCSGAVEADPGKYLAKIPDEGREDRP